MNRDDHDLETREERERGPGTGASTPMGTHRPAVEQSLTLEFRRVLTEAEWREVIAQIKAHVPYVRQLRANSQPVPLTWPA